ncbi:glutathione S-transferase family protein [Marivivens marinus]|uniref:glutathione S-transferase family protein n=1 Tax=Marivivens marinus TaxID=3110173 RepID=UPI003B846351
MKLVVSSTSPFVRKVRVLLRELGQEAAVEEIGVKTSPLAQADAAVSANPIGKIPALLLDDGSALHDSRVITRFFDDHFAGGFYPVDRLWQVLTLESMADAMIEAGVLMTYEVKLRPETARFGPWVEAQWARIDRTLDHLEAVAQQLDAPLDMGQVALACALEYLDFRHDARNWRNGRPRLAAWLGKLSARPSMIATVPVE